MPSVGSEAIERGRQRMGGALGSREGADPAPHLLGLPWCDAPRPLTYVPTLCQACVWPPRPDSSVP